MLCPLTLLLSVSTVVLCGLFLAQPIDARSGGVADYIRAGLAVTTRTTATHHEGVTTATPPTTSTTSNNRTAEDISALATCAASWSSYSIKATANVGFTAVTYTTATLVNTTVVYGTGDVYTSYGRIPVVSGSFTPTSTANRLFNVSTTTFSQTIVTSNPALTTETPACSFSPKSCSRLYVSYISSLGLPSNASVPKITPAPANSPHCPDYYYKPYSSSYVSTQSDLTEDCKLYGNSVELFYFPSTTPGEPDPTAPVTYVYKEGTTFTSPSIYLSFDYISATRYIPQSVDSYTVSCGVDGCVTQAAGGGNQVENQGTMISGQILTMAPSDVSSIVLKYNTAEASAVISTVVGGLPGYGNIGQDLHLGAVISASLTAERLRIEDLVHPPPRAYYLRPEGAPGCGSLVHSPRCATIFEADYRAIISLPSEVSGLQGAWKTCNPAIYGVYDPPIALTERASVAKPTLPPGVASPAYETTQAPTRGRPYTITPPLATPAGTALRDVLPSATNGGIMRPRPSSLSPSAPSDTGRGQNGDQSGASSPHQQDQAGSRLGGLSNNGPEATRGRLGASSNSMPAVDGDQPGASSYSGSDINGQRPGASSDSGPDGNGDRLGSSSNSGSDENGDQPGASTNSGPDEKGDRPGASTNSGPNENGDQPGALSNSGPDDDSGGTKVFGGTTMRDGPDSDYPTTGTSDPDTVTSSNTATADRSGPRESSDVLSSTATSDSSQTGSSTRLSTYGTWSVGAVLLTLMF